MPDDLRRSDISRARAATPGEDYVISFTVREEQADGSFIQAVSFAGYSDWALYVFDDLRDAGASAVARGSAAIYTLSGSNFDVTTAPNAVATAAGSVTALVAPGDRGYELWATANSLTKRLAYGTLPFAH